MTAVLDRIPVNLRLNAVYLGLGIVAFLAGAMASIGYRTPVVTHVQHVHATYTAATPAEVVAAWGKPSSVIDGAQINQALAGTKCAVYQSKHALICY